MTPRDVDQLTHDEYRAMWRYRENRIRAENRAARRR